MRSASRSIRPSPGDRCCTSIHSRSPKMSFSRAKCCIAVIGDWCTRAVRPVCCVRFVCRIIFKPGGARRAAPLQPFAPRGFVVVRDTVRSRLANASPVLRVLPAALHLPWAARRLHRGFCSSPIRSFPNGVASLAGTDCCSPPYPPRAAPSPHSAKFRFSFFEFRDVEMRSAKFDVNHDAHNRLDSRRFRRLIKRHCRIQPIRIRQRHGRHFLLHSRRDNLLGGRYAPQKRIVAVTMKMDKHVTGDS